MNEKLNKKLLIQTRGIVFSLTLQFILGMVLNLFAAPPDDPRYTTESPIFKIVFVTHAINGIVLPFFALSILFFAFKSNKLELKNTSIYGIISMFVAALGGILTITLKEGSSEIASFIMAVGFVFALIYYGKLYFLVRK